MKYFKIKYANGEQEIKKAKDALALIRENELYTKDHITTRIFELSGKQEAIARSNEDED